MRILSFFLFTCSLSASYGQISFGDDGRSGAFVQGAQNKFDIVFEDAPTINSPACQSPEQRPGLCKPLAQCAIFYAEIPSLLERPCQTQNGQKGVCCPTENHAKAKPIPPGVGSDGVLSPPPIPDIPLPRISLGQITKIADVGIQKFKQRLEKVTDILFNKKVQIPRGSPSAAHQKFFTTTNAVLEMGNSAQINIEASMSLINSLNLSPQQGTFALPSISVRGTSIESTCPPVAKCNLNYPYRTMDGSCNNKQNPDWGKSQVALQRILPPKYGDGVNSPRVQSSGLPLPSARLISEKFIPDENRPYANLTLMMMQWGQFVDHDLDHTPIVKGENSTGVSCCQNGKPLPSNLRHPDCFPIEIPADDSFYQSFGQRCMEFVRSLPAPRKECNLGPREQMNQITAYIDGSNIYGSSEKRARSLRTGVGGKLITQKNRGTDLLPSNPNECSDPDTPRTCFRAGDLRVNEQIELAVMHTVWMREHNRIAGELAKLNPNWNDEILYQEARRIVIAELQHIIYNEFLPLVLGPDYMRTFELQPKQRGHTKIYNPDTDATITNAFSTAAYRFGHTLVQGIVKTFNQFGAVSESLSFEKTQFAPFKVYDNFDSFVRGLTTQECQRFDHFASEALTNHLFQGSSPFGLDLMSLNIQRGRDHGLPPYNDWREVCGLPKINSWDELTTVMDPQAANILRRLYPSVDEIDLFIGGIGERALPGAILGPTFVCIVGDQFARLRRGDRFFYEEVTARFTEAQLDQIRKVSLARVLCDNSDEITIIQPLVFQQASFLNQRQPCNSETIPSLDMRFWTERRRDGQRQRDGRRNRGRQQ
jgi:peroxidase